MLSISHKNLIRPQLLLVCAWIVIVFCDERLFYKFFLSNLIAIGLAISCTLYVIVKQFKNALSIIVITGLFLITTAISYLQFGPHPHFLEELLKVLLVIVGGIAVSKTFSTESLEFFLKPVAVVMGCYFFIQAAIIGTPDYNDLRFGLYATYGNPNTVAFLICVCIILLLYCYRPFAIAKWLLIIFLCALLAKTYSRSAIFGMCSGMLFAFIFRRKTSLTQQDLSCFIVMLLIAFSLFILYLYGTEIDYMRSMTFLGYHYHPHFPHFHQYTINNIGRFSFSDIQQTHLSGRLTAWVTVLHALANEPRAWLTGFGPGLVIQLNLLKIHYPTIDSLVLSCFYSYGLIGLGISLWFCFKLLITKSITHRYQILKAILGFLLVFTMLANNTTSASQVILYGMLLVGFVLSKETGNRHESA